jgi:hypothetical protein
MTFTGTVKNQGTASTLVGSNTRLGLDVGNNGSEEIGDLRATGILASGAIELETWSSIWTSTAGTHKFEVCADVGSVVSESNETNNCTSMVFTVSAAGDITPPTTSITSPVDGVTVSNTITISASASDNVAVAKVEFLIDGTLLGTDISAPYSFPWDTKTASNGSHTLISRATDTSGNIGESAPITVTVSNAVSDTTPPTVSITNPADGSSVKRNSTVTITASASDNVGVTKVEFYVDGSLKCTDSILPYGCSWKVPGKRNATYTIQAKAYDAAGNTKTHSVTVKAQ